MIHHQTIDQLANKITGLLPPGVQQIKVEFDQRVRQLLQQQLVNLDMVSREEFDIQSRVLERTRSKLETLEAKLKELEQALEK